MRLNAVAIQFPGLADLLEIIKEPFHYEFSSFRINPAGGANNPGFCITAY